MDNVEYYDVRAGSYDSDRRVYRFSGTKRGKERAQEYADAFNASYRASLELRDEDVHMRSSPHMSQDDYDKASMAELYRANLAYVVRAEAVSVIGDDDPMPTDYSY